MNNHQPNIWVFTGAGLSAPSGIHTFRDPHGLWQNYDIDQVCNYSTWKRNGVAVHELFNMLREKLPAYQPNAAHHKLASWKKQYGKHCEIFTQNVDDLLNRAGCEQFVQLHGDLLKQHCTQCDHKWTVGYASWTYGVDACVRCASKKGVKPAVVMFHEHAPEYMTLTHSMKNITHNTLMIVIGTSGMVVDINSMIFDKPGKKILNNLESSPDINSDYFDHVFYESAHIACDKIDQLVKDHMKY